MTSAVTKTVSPLVTVLILLGTTLLVESICRAQSISVGAPSRLTLGPGGAGADSGSGSPILSPNGTFFAFRSDATNLLSETTNGANHIYLDNLTNGSRTLVSRQRPITFPGTQGDLGNNDSRNPTLSPFAPDGFVALAFESDATNLSVFPDFNGTSDIFVYIPSNERGPEFVERVSFSPPAASGLNPSDSDGASSAPSITIIPEPDRALVAFSSEATNLLKNTSESNGFKDIYLSTVLAPESTQDFSLDDFSIQLVSQSQSGQAADGDSDNAKIAFNGSAVVFESEATNLIDGQTVSGKQIYLKDLNTGTITLVSRNAIGQAGNADSSSPTISYNGGFVVYLTEATNLLANSETGEPNIVRYNVRTGENERVNASANGVAGSGTNSGLGAFIGGTGRFITFSDDSGNLVPSDTNGVADIFVKDMDTGAISRISIDASAQEANAGSSSAFLGAPTFNSTSGSIVYGSQANNLVNNDTEGNTDIFLNGASFTARTFRPGTQLEVPGDVSFAGRRAVVTAEVFDGFSSSASARVPSEDGILEMRKRRRERLVYEAVAEPENGKRRQRRRKQSRNSQITLNRLKPGTVYDVSYRTKIMRGKRTVAASDFSPPQRIRAGLKQ